MSRFVLLILAVLSLAACGGRGGGGGGGNAPALASYSLSRSSVSFTATQGDDAPASQQVTETATSGKVYLSTTQSGTGFSHTLQITGDTTATITIVPETTVVPGNFSGTVTVRGCAAMIAARVTFPAARRPFP